MLSKENIKICCFYLTGLHTGLWANYKATYWYAREWKQNAVPTCEGEGQPGLLEPGVFTPALPLPHGPRASHLTCQTHPESVSSCAQRDDSTSSLIKALCENLSESVLKMKKHSRHNRWWYDQIYEGLNMTCSLTFQLWAQICPKYSVVGRWEGRRGGFKYGGMVGADEARHRNILDVFQPQYWLSCTVFWDQKKICILVKPLFFCSQVDAWVLTEHICWLCPYSLQVNRHRSPCIARDVVKLSANSWLCRCQQQLHFVIPSHVSPN